MMFSKLPRRKRKMAVTAVLSVAVACVLLAATWILTSSAETYQPGQEIEGLTDDLSRDLPADYPRVTFTDATADAGIDFLHFPGKRSSQLPEDMGSGAAWGDYDNDGWMDLYVVDFAAPLEAAPGASRGRNVLYRNNRDGTFADVSVEAGVDLEMSGMAAAWGDYDNDGWSDLLITSYGGITLMRNDGDGTFTDVSELAGLASENGFWTGAAWGDYNRDGRLDLYVTGYVKYEVNVQGHSLQYDVETPASINPSSFEPERNLLFRGRADGTFEEVGLRSGVENARGRSLSAVWVDLNEDGWIDLYVANDVSDNVLYLNRGDETFDEASHQALVADYRGAMGIATGDWDGDADIDMFVTHWIAQENALYQNTRSDRIRRNGKPGLLQFMDVADRYGLGQIALDFIGWGTSFFDYDNDERLDLFVVNGSTFQQSDDPTLLVPMRDQLFWNRGPDEGFFDVSSVSGSHFQESDVGRGAAFADYDNDGDVDVFIVNHGGAPVLLRNDRSSDHSWLEVSLEGTLSNRSAFGARLRLVAGGHVQVRQVGSQGSYLSQNSPVEHFGLGDNETVDSLVVHWPSGTTDVHANLPVDQRLDLVEGEEMVP